jgi:hypothetical protein
MNTTVFDIKNNQNMVDNQNMVETQNVIETQNKVIQKISTDRMPICMDGFCGTRNNCLGFLHHSVKPKVGVVKYDFKSWYLFPTNVSQAKELALKWSNSFEKRKDFVDKNVIIFFHLEMKTIRVEVKQKKTETDNENKSDNENKTVKTEEQLEQEKKVKKEFKYKQKPQIYSKFYPYYTTNNSGYIYDTYK